MPRFVSSVYPALMFRVGDKKFKFAGGKLDVPDEDAETVRAFARERDLYGIAEVGPVAVAEPEEAEAAPEPEPEPEQPEQPENEVVGVGIIPPEAEPELETAEEQPDAEPLDGDIEDMTNRQLDELLESKGLSKRGNHAEKVARLRAE